MLSTRHIFAFSIFLTAQCPLFAFAEQRINANDAGIAIGGSVSGGSCVGNCNDRRDKSDGCKRNYLSVLLLNEFGNFKAGMRGHDPRSFTVAIGNTTESCIAIVSRVHVEVLEFKEDHSPQGVVAADVSTYKHKVLISPEHKGRKVAVSFKRLNYPPMSNPDDVQIDIVSMVRGFSYAVRFVFEWYDLKTGIRRASATPTAMAVFSDGKGTASLDEARKISTNNKRQLDYWKAQFDSKNDF